MQRQEDNSWKLLFDKKHGQWGAPSPTLRKLSRRCLCRITRRRTQWIW
jgi:hypothetical protein